MTPGILSSCSNYPTKIISDFSVFFNPSEIFIVFFDGDLILPKKVSLSHLPSRRSSSLPSSMAYNRGAREFSSEDFTGGSAWFPVGFGTGYLFGGLGWVWNWPAISAVFFVTAVTAILRWWLICSGKNSERNRGKMFAKYIPRIPRGHNKYHGYTYVRGTLVLVPWLKHLPQQNLGCDQPKPDILRRFCSETEKGLFGQGITYL